MASERAATWGGALFPVDDRGLVDRLAMMDHAVMDDDALVIDLHGVDVGLDRGVAVGEVLILLLGVAPARVVVLDHFGADQFEAERLAFLLGQRAVAKAGGDLAGHALDLLEAARL